MFTDDELTEIAGCAEGDAWGDPRNSLGLVASWAVHVATFDRDRPLAWDDRSVWNEYDLVAALHIRSGVESSTARLPAPLSARLAEVVQRTDELFRSFTVEDSGVRITRISDSNANPPIPVPDGWWWRRVPMDGPIAKDFTHYDDEGNWVGYGDDWPPASTPADPGGRS